MKRNIPFTEKVYLTRLRQLLTERLSEGELRTFCFELDIDYESLPDEGKENKARELLHHLDRRRRVIELVEVGKRLRPDIAWDDISGVDTQKFNKQMGQPTQSQSISEEPQAEIPQAILHTQPIGAIVVEAGPSQGRWIFLTGQPRKIVFGRVADINISDIIMSRSHFAVILTPAENVEKGIRSYRIQLVDMGSANGTFVNGRQTTMEELHHGDLIHAGNSAFRLRLF